MKFLHTSDWHLGRRPVGGIGNFSDTRFNDYFQSAKWVVEKAVEERVDLILISGDIFDKNTISPEVLDRTMEIFEIAKDNEIAVFAIEGNHDRSFSGQSWVAFLEKMGYLKLLNSLKDAKAHHIPFKGFNFYGFPYLGVLTDKILNDFMERIETNNNILMVHTAISSSEYLPGTVDKEVIDKLGRKFIYIAGGHFHSYSAYPSENPFFFIPGSPEYWDLYERDQKGIIIYDTEIGLARFIPSKKRRVLRFEFQCKSNAEISENVRRLIDTDKISENDIAILNFQVTEFDGYVNADDIEKFVQKETSALKVIVRLDYESKSVLDISNINSNKIELLEKSIITEKWKNEFSSKADETVRLTNALKKILRESGPRSDIFAMVDEFLTTLLKNSGGIECEDQKDRT